jgi:D-glycero-alpha-D-manno-heptose 1-phosphate guanylyltransferase
VGNTFFVLNGDSAVEVDLSELFFEHKRRNAAATLTVVKSGVTERYGQVQLDSEARVTGFSEKSASEAQPSPGWGWINGGVYVFERPALSFIPPAPPAVSLETFLLPKLIGKGLNGFRSEGYFIDIGVPEDFERAQEELPRRYGYVHSHTR